MRDRTYKGLREIRVLGLGALLLLSACGNREGLELSNSFVKSVPLAVDYTTTLQDLSRQEQQALNGYYTQTSLLYRALAQQVCEAEKIRVYRAAVVAQDNLYALYDTAAQDMAQKIDAAYAPLGDKVKILAYEANSAAEKSRALPLDKDRKLAFQQRDALYLAGYAAYQGSYYRNMTEADAKLRGLLKTVMAPLTGQVAAATSLDCAQAAKAVEIPFQKPAATADGLAVLVQYLAALEKTSLAYQNYFSAYTFTGGNSDSLFREARDGLITGLSGADGDAERNRAAVTSLLQGLSGNLLQGLRQSFPQIDEGVQAVKTLVAKGKKTIDDFVTTIPVLIKGDMTAVEDAIEDKANHP